MGPIGRSETSVYNYQLRCKTSQESDDLKKTDLLQDACISHLVNPLNAELNPICYLLALLGAHHFLHVSRISVKDVKMVCSFRWNVCCV